MCRFGSHSEQKAPDGNWYVPDVRPNDWNGRQLNLNRDNGKPDSDYVVGAVGAAKFIRLDIFAGRIFFVWF
ncbi:MAG: hypothetical protein LBM73_03690 [Candidatus Nomurabacteria bacterium]|jgi:hypothetical protein|nr:hypothetical protein [Candidatus Nomurabacteria bacterium]